MKQYLELRVGDNRNNLSLSNLTFIASNVITNTNYLFNNIPFSIFLVLSPTPQLKLPYIIVTINLGNEGEKCIEIDLESGDFAFGVTVTAALAVLALAHLQMRWIGAVNNMMNVMQDTVDVAIVMTYSSNV